MAKNIPPNKKQSNPTSDKDNPVKLAKVGMWQAIIVALITTIGGGVVGYFTGQGKDGVEQKKATQVFVPIQETKMINKLPEENNIDDYQLIKDISIFDLRQWKFTPDSLKNTRYSPANYTNYLHIKKVKPLNKIVIHYATSGYAIDMRCITNAYNFYQKSKPEFHDNKIDKEYALEVDIATVPVGQEFLVVVEATYWNGFNNLSQEDASTYTDTEIHGLDELGLIVFYPDNKPFKEYQLLDRENKSGIEDSYRGDNSFYADKNKKFIYWSVKERQPDHHYRLQWTW